MKSFRDIKLATHKLELAAMVRFDQQTVYHSYGWPVHTHIWKQFSWFKGATSGPGDTSIEIRIPLNHDYVRFLYHFADNKIPRYLPVNATYPE